MDNETLAFGVEHEPTKLLKHPVVTALHVVFRTLSMVLYLFCGLSSSGFIGSFVIIVLLVSVDFWIVKNITGRLMVGLRWWNYIDDDGKSHWIFEAKKGDRQGRVTALESRVFWAALVATPVVWTLFLFIAFMRFNFKWIILVFIALVLSGSNLYGYVKCKVGQSEGITGTVKNFASGVMQKQMISNMASYFSRTPPSTNPSTTI